MPSEGTICPAHDNRPWAVDRGGSLRVRVVGMRCPPSAMPPIAGRAVSTRFRDVVVESVGVGSGRVVVAPAGGFRGGGWVEVPPRVSAATATQREGKDCDQYQAARRPCRARTFRVDPHVLGHEPSIPPTPATSPASLTHTGSRHTPLASPCLRSSTVRGRWRGEMGEP